MKKVFTLFVLALSSTSLIAQTSGGPDVYGYEWRNSNDGAGPTYNWIDITTMGTQVSGLTDDNSVGMVDMNMDFHYYWSDYNQIKIGSNGWLSFENIGNIASCFPAVPTSGGAGDNILAPFMTDLLFGGAAPSEVWYYHDVANEEFIVSYIAAPWWQTAAPGYVGSNTFQVILAAQDSSITFQYETMDATILGGTPCVNNLEIGIENITGNVGLEVYNNIVPASNLAVKFYYPQVITFQVPDATPSWTQSLQNEASIKIADLPFILSTNISNEGNTDITTSVDVAIEIQDMGLNVVHADNVALNDLLVGVDQQVDFSAPALGAGQYYVVITVTNSEDINPLNNVSTTELELVDNTANPVVMTYATQDVPTGALLWDGVTDDGGSIHIIPPYYPVTLESVDMFIMGAINQGETADYTVEIAADDGANNTPGTILASEAMAAGTYTSDAWVNTALTTPLDITSGGIHVIWKAIDSVSLGTETAGPISNRTYELVSGSWANYRSAAIEDFLINANFAPFSGAGIGEEEELSISIYPNPNNGIFTIVADQVSENITYTITNLSGEMVLSNQILNGTTTSVNLSKEARGVYFVTLSTDKAITTKRIVVQ